LRRYGRLKGLGLPDRHRLFFRPFEADGLDVDLMELTETALLRFFVPEHRPDAPHLVASTAQHAVGDDRAHHARRRLRTQRERFAALVGETVHLFLDDIGVLTDRAFEEVGVLHHRHTHLVVAVRVQEFAGDPLEELPTRRLGGQQVVHALDGRDRGRAHGAPPGAGDTAGASCVSAEPAAWGIAEGVGSGLGSGGSARIAPEAAISKRATELRTASAGITAALPLISSAVASPRPNNTRSGGAPCTDTR